jgi:hypothetical protein
VDLSVLHAWHPSSRTDTECAINVAGMIYTVKASSESIDKLKEQSINEDKKPEKESEKPESVSSSVRQNVKNPQFRKK